MKNVFLLPTDKPSRVYLIKSNNRLGLTSTNPEYMENFGSGTQNQHLYITSDEEIKDCFVINTHTNEVYFLEGYYGMQPRTKKIILTTDQDLIDLGVQSIDDEFLQWYIKNPSCEEVDYCNWNEYYKITPKEETKLKNICIKCGVDLYATEGRFTCQQSECRGIIVSKETLQEWADNEERKRHLIEIMKGDEELGLYDMVQHKPTQETKLTFIEWIGLFRWMGKTS